MEFAIAAFKVATGPIMWPGFVRWHPRVCGYGVEHGDDGEGGIGGFEVIEREHRTLLERGPDRVNPFSIPQIIPNMGAGWVSMYLGTRGPLSSQCTACAASNNSTSRPTAR